MTLTLDLDLDVLMMYLLTRNEVCSVRLSRVRAEQDRQTMDRRDRTYYHIFNILTHLKRFSNVSTVVCWTWFCLACEDAWYLGDKALDCSDLHAGMFRLHSCYEILHLQQPTAPLLHCIDVCLSLCWLNPSLLLRGESAVVLRPSMILSLTSLLWVRFSYEFRANFLSSARSRTCTSSYDAHNYCHVLTPRDQETQRKYFHRLWNDCRLQPCHWMLYSNIYNKKLCYCREIARRVTSVELLWPFFDWAIDKKLS